MKADDSGMDLSGEATVPATIFPHAFYESNGTVFELYSGGQRYRPTVMRWKRLKTVTFTREGDCIFEVLIKEGQREFLDGCQ